MSWRLEDSASVIHPVVGCSDTQNWVRADRLRGPGRAVVAGWMAAETVEPGTIYLVDLVGSTRLALRRQRRSVVRDQRSSSPASRSAIGTDRRVERSDLPSVECSPRTNASRTRMGWIVQSTSRQRRPSSSDWRRPVVAAARISTRNTGPRTSGGRGGAGPGLPFLPGFGARTTTSSGIARITASSSSTERNGRSWVLQVADDVASPALARAPSPGGLLALSDEV